MVGGPVVLLNFTYPFSDEVGNIANNNIISLPPYHYGGATKTDVPDLGRFTVKEQDWKGVGYIYEQ